MSICIESLVKDFNGTVYRYLFIYYFLYKVIFCVTSRQMLVAL